MKIGIIGTGWVGASVAISVLHDGTARELLLHDARGAVAEGEAMDLRHGAAFYPTAEVRAVALEEMNDCDAVVIAAGRGGGPGQSRLELLRDNAAVARDLGAKLARARGIVVVVTNPVDVMTQLVVEASGLPPARVLGTGTMLDTARLRQVLGRELQLEPRSIHGQVLGEHGDSEVVVWSGVEIGGQRLRARADWTRDREVALGTEVRPTTRSGWSPPRSCAGCCVASGACSRCRGCRTARGSRASTAWRCPCPRWWARTVRPR